MRRAPPLCFGALGWLELRYRCLTPAGRMVDGRDVRCCMLENGIWLMRTEM